MGNVRLHTLGDAARLGLDLRISCGSCGHEATVAAAILATKAGRNRPLHGLRFRCTACGGQGEVRVSERDRVDWRLALRGR